MKHLTRLVAALALGLLLPLLHAPSASAAQVQSSTGQRGSVWVDAPMITGYDHRVRMASGYYLSTKSWEVGGFTAGRSPAYAGAQDIVGVYIIQRYVGGRWVGWTNTTYSGRTSSGALTFPRWVYNPATLQDTRYAYRTVYFIAWMVAGTDRQIASATIMPNRVADNRCVMQFGTRCEAYWDGIVF
jgi:hypothetical protein